MNFIYTNENSILTHFRFCYVANLWIIMIREYLIFYLIFVFLIMMFRISPTCFWFSWNWSFFCCDGFICQLWNCGFVHREFSVACKIYRRFVKFILLKFFNLLSGPFSTRSIFDFYSVTIQFLSTCLSIFLLLSSFLGQF